MNRRARKRCKFHIIGQYYHSPFEVGNFCLASEVDRFGTSMGILYYNYCPNCGWEITEKIKAYQMSI